MLPSPSTTPLFTASFKFIGCTPPAILKASDKRDYDKSGCCRAAAACVPGRRRRLGNRDSFILSVRNITSCGSSCSSLAPLANFIRAQSDSPCIPQAGGPQHKAMSSPSSDLSQAVRRAASSTEATTGDGIGTRFLRSSARASFSGPALVNNVSIMSGLTVRDRIALVYEQPNINSATERSQSDEEMCGSPVVTLCAREVTIRRTKSDDYRVSSV